METDSAPVVLSIWNIGLAVEEVAIVQANAVLFKIVEVAFVL